VLVIVIDGVIDILLDGVGVVLFVSVGVMLIEGVGVILVVGVGVVLVKLGVFVIFKHTSLIHESTSVNIFPSDAYTSPSEVSFVNVKHPEYS